MKNFKKALATILCIIIVLTATPLVGPVGLPVLNLFGAKAEATTSGLCGENLTYMFDADTGKLTINGKGEMRVWISSDDVPWYNIRMYIKEVVISNDVTSIGDYAFYCYKELASITIPDSVTSIGKFAFSECSNLADITIPDSVTSIGKSAFSGTKLYNDSYSDFLYIGNHLIAANDSFFRTHSSYEIKSGTITIADDAFSGCDSLENITIPEGVIGIGARAFYKCSDLASITIPDSVTSIGAGAFAETKLYNDLYNGVLYIGNHLITTKGSFRSSNASYSIKSGTKTIACDAFSGCSNLPNILIPDSVTTIGESAFNGCKSLTYITIPGSVTYIGCGAFNGCSNLLSVKISGSVTCIEEGAFFTCNSLGAINVDSSNTRYSSIDGILFDKDKTQLIRYPTNKRESSYRIPSTITHIGFGAFYGCSSLKDVTIPDGVTTISKYAFECSNLSGIMIPDSVTNIGEDAFYDSAIYNDKSNWEDDVLYIGKHLIATKGSFQSSKSSYTIKSGTKTIADYAFKNCPNLTHVIIPNSVTSIGDGVFKNSNYATAYYKESCELWDKISIGRDNSRLTDNVVCEYLSDRPYYRPYSCGKNLVATLYLDGELVINGTGSMTNWESPSAIPWDAKRSLINKVTIGDEVTRIGDYALFFCSNLTSVAIPDSVTSIGKYAFKLCPKLGEIFVPLSVTKLADSAFDKTDAKIICFENSAAHKFAVDKGMRFELVKATLDKYNLSLIVGDISEITASFDSRCTSLVKVGWKSGNNSIATVDESGKVTAVAPGKTIISAIAPNGAILANCTVTVMPDKYTVSWVIDGKTTTQIYKIGEKIVEPEDPELEGHTFVGWSPVVPETMPAHDMTFTAEFEICKYTVKWIVNGKETTESYDFGSKITKPADPELDGYDFMGWSPEVPETMPAHDMTFTAVFELRKYNATLVVDGKLYKTIEYTHGQQSIDLPPVPEKEGYTGKWEDYTLTAGGVTINAVYTVNSYTVKWVVNGKETAESYDFGSKITKPAAPELEGYDFMGWSPEVPETMPAHDMTFTAVFEVRKHNANLVVDGKLYQIIEYTHGQQSIDLPPVPEKKGYTGKWEDYTLTAGGVTINAVYTVNSYTVKWVISGKETTESYDFGSKITKPADPELEGYDFMGWSPEVPETMPAHDMTFTAVFEVRKYNANLVVDGKLYQTIEYTHGQQSIDLPPVPEKEGYTGKWEDYTLTAGGVTINAIYTVNSYTVKWVISGKETTESYDFGSKITKPAAPELEGYDFKGWSPEVPETMPAHDLTFTAVFEPIKTKISIRTPSTTTVSYGFTLNLHANVTDLPEGARIVWSMDGSGFELIPSADGMTCGVKSVSKGSATITAKVVDKNGNAVKDANGNEITASQKLTSKAGFFQKLAAFFKKLFGSNMVIPSSLNKLVK